MKLSGIQSRLSSLTGKKKRAAAFALGAVMTLALPPAGIFPVLLLCVPGFIWLAEGSETKRDAFLTGWAFGAGYFVFGLYWVSVALFVDIAQFWWVLPFSAGVGPAALGLFYGLIPLLAWRYRRNATAHALAFAAAWTAVEWVRGHIFTGFPWNLPGYTWNHILPVMQGNGAIGIYGVTLLTLLWAAIPAVSRRAACVLGVSFALLLAAGTARLNLYPTAPFGDATVRIVQANIPQSIKWDEAQEWKNFEKHLKLTALPAEKPVTFVVWPETSVVITQQRFTEIAGHIAMDMPSGSVALIGNLGIAGDDYFNGVIALDKKANLIGTYNKHHLVPFGEYIPFRDYLNMTPVANTVANIGDFTPGAGIATLDLGNGLPRPSPLVCYEAIFPGEVARRGEARPDWLLNVTNDGWYGLTAGPHQHFESARVRAVEEGLPLVRAANTGISATVDPLGRIVGLKPLGAEGVLDTILPAPLPPTLYSRAGDTLFFLMLILLALFGEVRRRG